MSENVSPEQARENMKGCLMIFGMFVSIPVVIFAIIMIIGMTSNDSSGREAQYSAERACKSHVSSLLKAPSTASIKVTSSTENSDGWSFGGTVDAENSFGASIRSTWVCNASGEAGDWDTRAWID